ncbi:unnamed protein product [Cylicostephanus goldi]|uniref:Uncharacterized protein n=1 Tax=Cylicostephanus goldi TaxID=71465 RepID=A0A3P7QQY1_CYLGO|nr:unnamed protein product [Cylicostephanus goldi]
MVVRDDDDLELEEATNHASILQNKQLITNNVINKRKVRDHVNCCWTLSRPSPRLLLLLPL